MWSLLPGMRTSSRGARIVSWLAVASLWLGVQQGLAQERASDDLPRSFLDDIRYLKGPDGRPVAVPDKATLAEYLKWFSQRNEPPAASVSSLAFEGTTLDERIFVTARIGIDVSVDDTWVRVPLLMGEATLRDSAAYTGPGTAVPAPFQLDEGYSWWIKGKGAHVLVLPLSIPVRRQATQNRVQLALPTTAVSKLNLRVASPRVSANVQDRSTLTVKAVGQATEIEVIGLGNRLDLAWRPLPSLRPAKPRWK